MKNLKRDPKTITTAPSTVAEIKRRVLEAFADGDERISVLSHMNNTRDDLKVSVNTSDRTAITDQLLAENPELKTVIETRARGQRGKNKTVPTTAIANDISLVLEVFGERSTMRLKAVTVMTASGQEYTIQMAAVAAKAA